MNVFYVPQCSTESSVVMDETESNHCVRVLRLRNGDNISIIDGSGGIHTAQILDAHPKKCNVQILTSEHFLPTKPHLHIAIAPTKNIERLEWFVEKCVEIGISEITPIYCQKSERRNVNMERLEKVLVSAMKQSMQLYKPTLNSPLPISKFLESKLSDLKYIAYCEGENRQLLKKCYTSGNDVVIMIGPEGDFSKEEVQIALNNSFIAVSLGTSRLRTETAGVVACHTIKLLND